MEHQEKPYISGPLRFSASLRQKGLDHAIVQGSDAVRASERVIQNPQPNLINLLGGREGDVEGLEEMVQDLAQALEDQKNRLESGEVVRWEECLPEGSILLDEKNSKIRMGITLYRAAESEQSEKINKYPEDLEGCAEAIKATREEEIGRMVDVWRHDINNLFTSLFSYAQLLRLSHPGVRVLELIEKSTSALIATINKHLEQLSNCGSDKPNINEIRHFLDTPMIIDLIEQITDSIGVIDSPGGNLELDDEEMKDIVAMKSTLYVLRQRLKHFKKTINKSPKEKKKFSPGDLLNENFINFFKPMLSKRMGIDLRLSSEIGDDEKIEMDVDDFLRVIENLVKNSSEALANCEKKEKKIEIVLFRSEDMEEGSWKKKFKKKPKGYVVISVQDNGPGISEENRSTIFHEGFSTKGRQLNSGLGLCNVRNIIQSYGGEVVLQENGKPGTCFSITLPVFD